MNEQEVIHRFMTQMPVRFEVASGQCQLNGVILDCKINETRLNQTRVQDMRLINRKYH